MVTNAATNTASTVTKPNERTWNFTGKITSLTQCVEYLGTRKATTKTVAFALDVVAND